MAMTASTNTTANTALRYLNQNSAASTSSLAKLSSGSRIVRASDDAASLAIGTKIRADVTALKQAQVNAGQASSVLQVADGGLSQTTEILMRMKALSVQAQSGSVSDNERVFLDKEFQALASQINDIALQTKFNGVTLLDGSVATELDDTAFSHASLANVAVKLNGDAQTGTYQFSSTTTGDLTLTNSTTGIAQTVSVAASANFTGNVNFSQLGVTLEITGAGFASNTALAGGATTQFTVASDAMSFQVGVSSSDTIEVNLDDIRTTALGDGTSFLSTASIATAADAIAAGDTLDGAISQLNEYRAAVGALISRFEFASANLATTVENLDAARSVLLDVDMAAEMSNFSSKQVMLQASVAMLAQANQQPQQLLKLLG